MKTPGQRQRSSSALLLVAGGALALAAAFYFGFSRSGASAALEGRELAAEHLGRSLAALHPGTKVVIWSNPFAQRPGQERSIRDFELAGIEGLRRGLGDSVIIHAVVFPELKPEFVTDREAVFIDPHTSTPLSYVVTDAALDRTALEHPEATLIVSLIGLPLQVLISDVWKASDPRKFGLLLPDLRILGDAEVIRDAFSQGKIAAAVIPKPGAPAENEPFSATGQAEFDRRFLLLKRDNFDAVLKLYPRLFK